ncbi:hypothetical protein HK097_002812 [Rhizophlyctis rosea]|uniref:Uncharacterized protein n=1 Tax=Rhizophlyctis rosea TaxID=64517 RepID=A0AAD5X353_9FUNG|nr:hypothetical protein HK097_002812 [Rhizophlyctis rosea]
MTPTSAFLALLLPAAALAHGKLTNPLGLNVRPDVDLNSQSDVAFGVSENNPCGRRGASQLASAMATPRASFVAGSAATVTWHIQNQDGGGPLTMAFSGDGGNTFTPATITRNAPGRFSLTSEGGTDQEIAFNVPNMNCPAGQCLLMIRNPISFGSCAPVEITTGGANQMMITYTNPTGAGAPVTQSATAAAEAGANSGSNAAAAAGNTRAGRFGNFFGGGGGAAGGAGGFGGFGGAGAAAAGGAGAGRFGRFGFGNRR